MADQGAIRVLVVDDEERFRATTIAILKNRGFKAAGRRGAARRRNTCAGARSTSSSWT